MFTMSMMIYICYGYDMYYPGGWDEGVLLWLWSYDHNYILCIVWLLCITQASGLKETNTMVMMIYTMYTMAMILCITQASGLKETYYGYDDIYYVYYVLLRRVVWRRLILWLWWLYTMYTMVMMIYTMYTMAMMIYTTCMYTMYYQASGLKETYYGYDEDSESISSEMSSASYLSSSHLSLDTSNEEDDVFEEVSFITYRSCCDNLLSCQNNFKVQRAQLAKSDILFYSPFLKFGNIGFGIHVFY